MANIKTGQPAVDQAVGNLRLSPEKYTTLADLVKTTKDLVLPDLVQSYGDQGITGFLKLTGAIKNAGTADQIEYFEEGRRHRTLTLAATTAGTGDTGDFAIAADSTEDPATTKFAQTRDVIMNAATGVRYIITEDNRDNSSGGTDADELVLARLDGDAMSSDDDLAGNQEFIVLGNLYGQGTDQPEHFMQPELKRYKNPFMFGFQRDILYLTVFW